MEVDRTVLIAALEEVMREHALHTDNEGMTTAELREAKGLSKDAAQHLITIGLRSNVIRPARVWRNTNPGYRTRVPGWKLKDEATVSGVAGNLPVSA